MEETINSVVLWLKLFVTPSRARIGKRGAIAAIRTGLNYFLTREMKEEQETVGTEPV